MKPRIEKKLSKKLALLLAGTREYSSIWVDNEYYRNEIYPSTSSGGVLTPKQIRYNLESRVSVNHVPSIGGEADYWGEVTNDSAPPEIYQRGLYEGLIYTREFCDDDRQWAKEGTPERQAWEAFRDDHIAAVRRRYRRVRSGKNLLAHARHEGAVLRAKDARRAQALADFRAKRQQEAAARAA